ARLPFGDEPADHADWNHEEEYKQGDERRFGEEGMSHAATVARKNGASQANSGQRPEFFLAALFDTQVRALQAVDGGRDVASLHGEVVVFRAVDRAEEKGAVLEAALHHLHMAKRFWLAVRLDGVDRHDVRHAMGDVVE